ncbi:uncharacterized protein LAESUDRAFT_669644 [Laetiporus sulphureus 93-53]|uniref:DUF6534 domain-containing protein n=1 Tax=Laetiporus sulphureus 93-53 TaxID=1314785 RepID=A0A165IKZ2_9APHY|nr:uncharacterized protein LAESUDRAFT_669644 [Laetiporus sulphureus 93-53]KZT13225.1 hypothetical protein LAESUDRAFT_669644 [Laetiporus sulphureus 93-53]
MLQTCEAVCTLGYSPASLFPSTLHPRRIVLCLGRDDFRMLIAGPQFLGVCFNWALLGLLNLQVYLYYDYFPKDRWYLKCLGTKFRNVSVTAHILFVAYGMLIFEWVQTGLLTETAMSIYVYGYDDVKDLLEFHNTWFSATMMCGIISATVQIFLAWRIYKLSTSRVVAGIIVVLAVLQCVTSLMSGAVEKSARIAAAFDNNVIVVWLVASAVVDILIAVSMTILLLKNKTGIKSTDAIINGLVRLVVETGTLTGSCTLFSIMLFAFMKLCTASLAIIVLITASVKPVSRWSQIRRFHSELICGQWHDTLVYEAPAMLLTKRYSNTFLTNLNSREFIRRRDAAMIELAPKSELQFAQNVTVHRVEISTPPGMESSTSDAASVAFEGALGSLLTRNLSIVFEAQTKRPARRYSVI